MMDHVQRLLVVLLVAIASTSARSADLGPVVNPSNGHSYFVTDNQMTWADAEAWAISLGGHLVAINDAAEEAWMQGNLGLSSGYYWLGGSDAAVEGTFEWVTGEPFSYQSFLGGEPDDDVGSGGNGDYLALSVSGWGWLDTNGSFAGFVTGAIAEVTVLTGVGSVPAAPAGIFFQTRPTVTSNFTRLNFELSGTATVRCRIFDVNGRLVRELINGTMGVGLQELTWDTRDDGARRVPSGVYLIQLQVDGIASSRKVIVTR